MMTNSQIASILRNIAASYTIKNENKYRFQIIAYQKAAEAIEGTPTEVADIVKERKLEMLPGVGPSIRQHLEELIKTGKVKHFDWVTEGIPQAVFPLLNVPTLGPKKAYRLVKEFSLKDPSTVIEDVEKLAKMGKIATLEGFGEKSQGDVLRAINEFNLGRRKTKRMVLPYANELAKSLITYLNKSPFVKEAHPLGSLRRRKETVGDIDIAVASENPKKVIQYFIDYPHKQRVIEKGDTTASILVSSGKQIDLMVQPPKAFGALLQHFTGSKNHNVHLREYALKKGLSLSEYGIKKKMRNGKRLPAGKAGKIENLSTEKKFYAALGLRWIPPEIREDTGEIELAVTHKLPILIERKDIKGDLHLHSSFPIEPSHDMGKDSMETMIEKAASLRYEYVGFSEHNPSISKHTNMQIISLIEKKRIKIDQLNKTNKDVRVFNLLETDILSNGSLAIDNNALDLLDATLVSIHSAFNMSKHDMTKRVIEGLSHPKAKILSHPTGRLLNERPGYELDFEQIFAFCKKHNKALEINAWPSRLDLPDSLVRQAIKYGVKLIIDTDSHAVNQMDLMEYGVSVAKRGWATKHDILNTLPFDEFTKWLLL